MKRLKPLLKHSIWLMAGLLVFAISPAQAGQNRPYNGVPAFEFADDFYRANGVDPDNHLDHLDGSDARSVSRGTSPHPNFTDVEILEITGGFDHKGQVLYYTVNAKMEPDGFTSVETMTLANSFRAFIFPKAEGNPLSPAPPNRRHDNVFDTRNGYFSNNPLGLWILTFVSWNDPATEECLDEQEKLSKKNGSDLDGTPVLKTVSQIENMEAKGCITLQTRSLAEGAPQGFPWVV